MTQSHSLVLELQQLATDKSNHIDDLLRKALLVSGKLRTNDFRRWINHELHGYGDSKVPAYRTVRGELRATHPFHGLIPFIIQDQHLADLLVNVELRETIQTYVDVLERQESSHGILLVPLSQTQLSLLMSGERFPFEPVRVVGGDKLASVIDTVRTTILEWSLNLETEGIVGQGLTFLRGREAKGGR